MRVLVVAWEPVLVPRVPTWPRVAALVRALVESGDEVDLLTDPDTAARCRAPSDVRVTTTAEAPPILDHTDVRTSVLAGGLALQTAGAVLAATVDVVHAVAWHATHGAVALASAADTPLVASLLSVPPPGSDGRDVVFAHQTRWWLTYEARQVLVASARLARRVAAAYQPPEGTVAVAPYPRGASSPVDLATLAAVARAAHATASTTPDPGDRPEASLPPRLRLATT